jgi:hypothetical protein
MRHKETPAIGVRIGTMPVSWGRTSPKPIINSEIPTNLIKLFEFLLVHESLFNFSTGRKLFISPRINIIPPNIPCTIQSAVFITKEFVFKLSVGVDTTTPFTQIYHPVFVNCKRSLISTCLNMCPLTAQTCPCRAIKVSAASGPHAPAA